MILMINSNITPCPGLFNVPNRISLNNALVGEIIYLKLTLGWAR